MKLQVAPQGQYFLCLPRDIVRAKQWQKGDCINVTIDRSGDLVLKRQG